MVLGFLFMPIFYIINGIWEIRGHRRLSQIFVRDINRRGLIVLGLGLVAACLYSLVIVRNFGMIYVGAYWLAAVPLVIKDYTTGLFANRNHLRFILMNRESRVVRRLPFYGVLVLGWILQEYYLHLPIMDLLKALLYGAMTNTVAFALWIYKSIAQSGTSFWAGLASILVAACLLGWIAMREQRIKNLEIAVSGLESSRQDLIAGYEALRLHIIAKVKRTSVVQEVRELIEFLQLHHVGRPTQVPDIERWQARISLFRPTKSEKQAS